MRDLLNLIIPPACLVCGQRLDEQAQIICEACEAKIAPLGSNICSVCGSESTGNPCKVCAEEHFSFDSARSVFKFDGPVKELVHQLKYNGFLSPAGYFTLPVAELIDSNKELQNYDFICPVPLHRVRERERGYNQSALIAYGSAALTGIPYAEPVSRKIYTRSQTLLSKALRVKNLKGAFVIRDKSAVAGKIILLIDDVFTTGSTLNEVAKTLLAAGASKVTALTVARA